MSQAAGDVPLAEGEYEDPPLRNRSATREGGLKARLYVPVTAYCAADVSSLPAAGAGTSRILNCSLRTTACISDENR